ncbi:hypothetical protein TCARB_0054 [Thermofilum adornatum 1505]|uniref:Uncharacterized protein n=1 Tax=Thermofilum adornatum 1505 TaxID=697581 RepID=A0A3G1A480_9CREN|nr:hypothetical protein TCARB_0054 [Thermofilum adornatum 1505]
MQKSSSIEISLSGYPPKAKISDQMYNSGKRSRRDKLIIACPTSFSSGLLMRNIPRAESRKTKRYLVFTLFTKFAPNSLPKPF